MEVAHAYLKSNPRKKTEIDTIQWIQYAEGFSRVASPCEFLHKSAHFFLLYFHVFIFNDMQKFTHTHFH